MKEAETMTAETIKRILEDHSIEYMEFEGYIVAFERWTDIKGNNGVNFLDVTGWSRKQLFDWLGY